MVLRDVRRALQLSRENWRPRGRALLELALARVRFDDDHSNHLLNAGTTRRSSPTALTRDQARLVEQVTFAIPRVARRVPWRADCLVQALAGERWLRRRGIAAQIVIGVRKNGPAPLDAHAWLEAGDHIVTGGETAGFSPLTN